MRRVIFKIKEINILSGGIGVRTVNLKLEGREKACESGKQLSQERRRKNINCSFVVFALYWQCFYIEPTTVLRTIHMFSHLILG